jgi:hypothetical protein
MDKDTLVNVMRARPDTETDTEVDKQISNSRAAAGKCKMHNNKPELKIMSNLRSWIGFMPIQLAMQSWVIGRSFALAMPPNCDCMQQVLLCTISMQQHTRQQGTVT